MMKKIDIEKIPEKFKTLIICAKEQNEQIEKPCPSFYDPEAWNNGLKNFADQYKIDIYAMSEKDMALIDDRLKYWGS